MVLAVGEMVLEEEVMEDLLVILQLEVLLLVMGPRHRLMAMELHHQVVTGPLRPVAMGLPMEMVMVMVCAYFYDCCYTQNFNS